MSLNLKESAMLKKRKGASLELCKKKELFLNMTL